MNRNNPDLTRQIQPGEIQKIYEELQRAEAENFDLENRLNELKLTNAKRLSDLILDYHDKEYKRAVENANKVYKATEVLLQKEFSTKAILNSQQLHEKRQELTSLYAQEKEALKNKSKKEQAEIKKQFSQRRKDKAKELKDDLNNLKKTDKEAYKAYKARIKFETEERSKAARAALDNEVSEAKRQYGKLGNLVGLGKGVKKALDSGATPVEAAGAALDQAVGMISDYAKKLEGTMTSVAKSQTEIDTRLQGSKRTKNGLGSYWQGISDTITKNVGMSPFIKQEDVVSKLKDLVGSGISFNVEQRAFLDTISEKIATTFSATDASLVKLVRIQQADSTAARLGMESALTSFLNNMYETTEYMSEIASDIRSQIYEASALMGAEEAATFEYQVQK